MQVYQDLSSYHKGRKPVATIGTFDGVHLGHKKILQRLKDVSLSTGGESVLISFHPHPRLVLAPHKKDLQLIQTIGEKIESLRAFGIDKLLLIPFTRAFAETPSQDFVKKIIVETVGVSRLVIGYDHHFGRNRSGNITELQKLAPQYGFEVEEIPPKAIDNANVSSTKIREALLSGNIDTANTYLGYPYRFSGTVIHGQKQGRLLGYPTANLQIQDPLKIIPANGIYYVRAILNHVSFWGMMSIGNKPTMGDFERGIEVNLFDFNADIYGEDLIVECLAYIREEKKFGNIESLILAIDEDKAHCMKLISLSSS